MAGIQPSRREIVGGLVAAGLTGSLTTAHAQDKPAEGRVEKNVVYAMYSGLALLMDVYHPAKPNGYGIIWIHGSGWQAPPGHSNFSLKDRPSTPSEVKPLLDAGYTVFVINHRGIPEFKYPAAQEDCQRAVRFVRANAKQYGIRADRIGATGGSSGGELALMLGVLDGAGVPDAQGPVGRKGVKLPEGAVPVITPEALVARQSAKVQCVVAWRAPSDFLNGYGENGRPRGNYLGTLPGNTPDSPGTKLYREASPVTHVTKDDPPTLLVHGDSDTTVPIKHAELMEEALKKAGVPVKLVRLKGGGHGSDFRGAGFKEAKDWPDYQSETVRWFDQYLQKK